MMNDPAPRDDDAPVPPEHPADTTHPVHPDPGVVPIPVALAHLPVVAGMAVPWVTALTADGRPVFGQIDATRHQTCLVQRLCQVCGDALQERIVFLVRDRDLDNRLSAEPGLHPWCAAYTLRVCPMIAARMDHYRSTPRSLTAHPQPGAPHDGDDTLSTLLHLVALLEHATSLSQSTARRGAPAEPWSAVWVHEYDVITDPQTRTLSASFAHTRVLKVRRVADLLTTGDGPPPAGGDDATGSQPR